MFALYVAGVVAVALLSWMLIVPSVSALPPLAVCGAITTVAAFGWLWVMIRVDSALRRAWRHHGATPPPQRRW